MALLPEDEARIREIFREESDGFDKQSNRFVLSKLLQIADAIDIQAGKTTGLRIGTETLQKLGFFGATPVSRRLKADYNNFASLADLAGALVDLGLIDAAGTTSAAAYGGYVAISGGASSALPTGWSVSFNGTTKVFTVTHNLGSASYAVVAFAYGASLPLVYITRNADTFTAEFDNSLGTPFDTEWMFALIPIV